MAEDDGLREIQLNGKQLVFLFMASTVVAVVIFLCGVMVGRGVRGQRPALEAAVEAASDPTIETPVAPAPAAASASNAPVAAQETLTYPSRLEGQEPVDEKIRPVRKPPTDALIPAPAPARVAADRKNAPPLPAAVRGAKPERTPNNASPATAPASPLRNQPAGSGFVVQVAAVNDRREAEAIASRLAGKGYPSFVTTPPRGAARTFRVRVGKYPTRREAEAIAARLEKEDQFKPWITR